MRNAYAVLGILIIIVGVGTYYAFTPKDTFMTLSSAAFTHNGYIPQEYTCDGDRYMAPPLSVSNIPEGTQSLVLVMDDPDIPQEIKNERGIEKFDHWVLYNLPATEGEIVGGTAGINGGGETGYRGPCPPKEYAPTEHRYIFRVYALPGTLSFIKAPTLDEVETAAKGSALSFAELIGRYERP